MAGIVNVEEVADDQYQATRPHGMPHTLQRRGKWFITLLHRLGVQPVHQALNNPHGASAATGRAQFPVRIRRKKKCTYTVTTPNRSPGDSRCQMPCCNRLEPCACTKIQTRTGVHHDQYRPFAFFLKYLCMWFAGACRTPPVHVADIIAGQVVSGFYKIDTTATET